ncbi:MAG: hypothetical protein HQ492_02240 [Woeseiaceae bacterium]|nr:hypothetical protein [Woeseiaceae bacterium]
MKSIEKPGYAARDNLSWWVLPATLDSGDVAEIGILIYALDMTNFGKERFRLPNG